MPLVLLCCPFFTTHTGCPLTEGPHQSSDPWGSGRSMTQPGYSAMVGNSPHLNQHGPYTAINPQDRLVSSALYLYTFYLLFIVDIVIFYFFLFLIQSLILIALDCLCPPEAAAAAPLPSELPAARQRGQRDHWCPLGLKQLWSSQPHPSHRWSRHHDG